MHSWQVGGSVHTMHTRTPIGPKVESRLFALLKLVVLGARRVFTPLFFLFGLYAKEWAFARRFQAWKQTLFAKWETFEYFESESVAKLSLTDELTSKKNEYKTN